LITSRKYLRQLKIAVSAKVVTIGVGKQILIGFSRMMKIS
jgi:hypothetical protein